jgi:hypothetical protein
MAWVGADKHAIFGLLLDEAGTPLIAAPAKLTTASTKLYLPHFARVAPGRLGMVWTGDSGLEVRYRSLNEDLSDGPSAGVIVNSERRCSQEHARIASRDAGDGAVIVWSTETLNPLGGRLVDGGTNPQLIPAASNALIGGNCSIGATGAPAIATGESGTLVGWGERFASRAGGAPNDGDLVLRRIRAIDFE